MKIYDFLKKKKIVPELKFAKIRDVSWPNVAYIQPNKDGTLPYGNASAGIDFYIPNPLPIGDLKKINESQLTKTYFIPEKQMIVLEAFGRILIPSGIKVEMPSGYVLVAFNKSGVCVKNGLVAGACVIDSDYTGEVHLHLINPTEQSVSFAGGDKILQFILMKLPEVSVRYTTPDKIHQIETIRGSGGFGSSCKK